jgi:hypothetical protein
MNWPHIRAFLRGVRDFRLSCTWADPERIQGLSTLDLAYDAGREFAHKVTFRRFDS